MPGEGVLSLRLSTHGLPAGSQLGIDADAVSTAPAAAPTSLWRR
jgi:hypothetical protein